MCWSWHAASGMAMFAGGGRGAPLLVDFDFKVEIFLLS